jgi:hypothetical protein
MITLSQAIKSQESLNAVPYPILLRCLRPLHTWGRNAHCWNGGMWLRTLPTANIGCNLSPLSMGNGVLWRIVFPLQHLLSWNVIHSQKYFQLNVSFMWFWADWLSWKFIHSKIIIFSLRWIYVHPYFRLRYHPFPRLFFIFNGAGLVS